MQFGVAHIAEIPEQVGAHAEDDVPERSLLAPVPELAELVADELLVVEVGVAGAARGGLALQHPRGVRPLLVGERGAHHVPPELAAVGGLHPRPEPCPAPPPPQQERDGADGEQDPARVVPRVQPRRRHGQHGAQRRGQAVPQARRGAAEQHAQRDGAAQRRGRADGERPHRRLTCDVIHTGRAEMAQARRESRCSRRPRALDRGIRWDRSWSWNVGEGEYLFGYSYLRTGGMGARRVGVWQVGRRR